MRIGQRAAAQTFHTVKMPLALDTVCRRVTRRARSASGVPSLRADGVGRHDSKTPCRLLCSVAYDSDAHQLAVVAMGAPPAFAVVVLGIDAAWHASVVAQLPAFSDCFAG